MAEFSQSKTYSVGDRVSYNDLYYECIVTNPDSNSFPDEGIYWNEAFIKLSDVVMKGFSESISATIMKDQTTMNIDIFGYYFDSSIAVSIPNCTVNINNITPGKIELSVTSGSTLGVFPVNISKSGVPNDGASLTLEVTDEITGTGSAGTFLTDFDGGDTGTTLWGPDWELEIFGNVNSIDQYFASSNAGTPSGSTGPNDSSDGTYYAFVETSNPNNGSGQYGSATTSNFRAISTIDFDYFMYGSDIGDLSVQGFDGGSWNDLQVLSGQQQTAQGDDWLHSTINCSDLTKVRFLFNSPTNASGYRADICVDNISIVSS